MHIAFDGGCFQQGILGGIYQVACGFLNAAKAYLPDLEVTLVCDPRSGLARSVALDGLTWRPRIAYAEVMGLVDESALWPYTTDPNVRFWVDGEMLPAIFEGGMARYEGPPPKRSFAIISRTSLNPEDAEPRRRQHGVQIDKISIKEGRRSTFVEGQDRRLSTGFFASGNPGRWTDGAGFVPLSLFPPKVASIIVDVAYTPLQKYHMGRGTAANAVVEARRRRNDFARALTLSALGDRLREEGCDAYFVNHFTPINIPGLVNVAWAYDLIPVIFPHYFHADAQANFQENLGVFAMADRVYAISECTRRDLISRGSIPESCVLTAGIAAASGFKARSQAAIDAVLSPLGLSKGTYILSVSTIEPRKNHLRLLQAYLALRNKIPYCPALVIVGNMGWDFQQMLSFRAENNLEEVVIVLSDRSENDLACLYSGALFSTYLSVYEGFGLPIVEAMACKCPVLTSDRSSMPEVAGNACLLVNPYSVDAIAAALVEMTSRGSLRAELADAGVSRARFYSWERSSRVIIDDLSSLISAN